MANETLAKLIIESVYYDGRGSHKCMRWKSRPIHHFVDEKAMNRCNARDAETKAGGIFNGWPYVRILGRRIRSHNAAWVLKTGEYPDGTCLPINGDKMDYSPDNLRVTNTHGNTGKKYKKHKRQAYTMVIRGKTIKVDACECGGP